MSFSPTASARSMVFGPRRPPSSSALPKKHPRFRLPAPTPRGLARLDMTTVERDAEPSAAAPTRLMLGIAFAAIYLIWGSTYLAIKYAIETVPPFLMTGARFLIAGGV